MQVIGATLVNDDKKSKKIKDTKVDNKENILSMKKRLVLSICFLIPLMYVAMHHMLFEWVGLPIPEFVNDCFSGNENALTFGFTQFLLLLPILYLNRNYFITGFKRLFKGTPNMDSLIAMRKYCCNIIWDFCNLYDWLWIR